MFCIADRPYWSQVDEPKGWRKEMATIGVREIGAAVRTLSRGQLARYGVAQTSETDRFERELASHMGSDLALAVNSGTSALVCALAALGIGPGDEVLVPAYTWVSTAAAAAVLGAVPILVEIDRTLTMDPDDFEAKITPRSRAVIPVHMLNLPCDMDRIMEVARRRGIAVVEDACQAAGVTYRGRKLGSIGDIGAFSFNQHKNLRSGEGGAVITNNRQLFVRAGMFHDVGAYTRPVNTNSEELPFVGMNLRMPELSSALLRPQLRRLDAQMRRRAQRRDAFLEVLSSRLDVVSSPHNDGSAAVGLTVWFDDPDEAAVFATARGVNQLSTTGRHVYSNWLPILGRRTYDGRNNPWTGREIDYLDCCPRTTAILERTCSVSLDPDVPLPVMRRVFRSIAATAPRSRRATPAAVEV
jgi:dTDP-4-amino-4,6-dideoxygalactose transaminase